MPPYRHYCYVANMTTDPHGWFLASQALDHRDTVAAIKDAMPYDRSDQRLSLNIPDERREIANDIAAELARSGYALVKLTPQQTTGDTDLGGFLAREKD